MVLEMVSDSAGWENQLQILYLASSLIFEWE